MNGNEVPEVEEPVDETNDFDSLWMKPKRELVDEIRDLRHDLEAANAEIAGRETEKSENATDLLEPNQMYASGGWVAPKDTTYEFPFPEIDVRRGGISFATPRWIEREKMSKKKLIRALEKADRRLDKERAHRRKAENKVRRLLEIIRDLA